MCTNTRDQETDTASQRMSTDQGGGREKKPGKAISALAREQGRHGAKVRFSLSGYNTANFTPAYVRPEFSPYYPPGSAVA